MRRGNWRVVPLKHSCTVRLFQEPTMKDSPPVEIWSACDVVVTKATIQISEELRFVIEKRWAILCNNSYPF